MFFEHVPYVGKLQLLKLPTIYVTTLFLFLLAIILGSSPNSLLRLISRSLLGNG